MCFYFLEFEFAILVILLKELSNLTYTERLIQLFSNLGTD